MLNLVEQIVKFVDFNDDYFYVAPNKTFLGYERNTAEHPLNAVELKHIGRSKFQEQPLTDEEAEYLLVNDIKRIEAQIQSALPWEKINKPRQAVCIHLAMLIGIPRLLKIENTLHALRDGKFEIFTQVIAALNLNERHQRRLIKLVEQMYTGEWCA